MKYFRQLPKIYSADYNNGKLIAMTNLLTRVNIIPEILNSPMMYYEYDIQDGDTPEIVSHKYYGSTDSFWLVLFANQILNPQWDWPLDGDNFSVYITDKYGSQANAQSQIHHYEKVITKINFTTNETFSDIIIIDSAAYANTIETTKTVVFPNTGTITIETTKRIIDAYDYELSVNESKRTIRLIDVKYAPIIEQQFMQLMEE
jgi:hypothetical protein